MAIPTGTMGVPIGTMDVPAGPGKVPGGHFKIRYHCQRFLFSLVNEKLKMKLEFQRIPGKY
jgi:hypothetical protein